MKAFQNQVKESHHSNMSTILKLTLKVKVNGIGTKMSDVANSTNQIQFCLFASGGKISAPATRSLFTFPMNSTLNFPLLTGTHDATRKPNLP